MDISKPARGANLAPYLMCLEYKAVSLAIYRARLDIVLLKGMIYRNSVNECEVLTINVTRRGQTSSNLAFQ